MYCVVKADIGSTKDKVNAGLVDQLRRPKIWHDEANQWKTTALAAGSPKYPKKGSSVVAIMQFQAE